MIIFVVSEVNFELRLVQRLGRAYCPVEKKLYNVHSYHLSRSILLGGVYTGEVTVDNSRYC